MLSVAMIVEGVLRRPDSEGHYDTGWALYQALAKNSQLYLLSHTWQPEELTTWTHRRMLTGHLALLHIQDPGPAGRLTALERIRIWRIGLVIEPDPACAAAEIQAGWSTLLHTHATYTRPAWRPDANETPRPWDELTAAIDREQRLRAGDPRNDVTTL